MLTHKPLLRSVSESGYGFIRTDLFTLVQATSGDHAKQLNDLTQEAAVQPSYTMRVETGHRSDAPYFPLSLSLYIPRCSMYGIFTYIWVIFG